MQQNNRNMKSRAMVFVCVQVVSFYCICGSCSAKYNHSHKQVFIEFQTDNDTINKAFRIALGDFYTNVQDYKIPILDTISPVVMAGLEYDSPWTRDAAINCWNAASFMVPDVAKNTLLSRIVQQNDSLIIRDKGNYWDAIIWCTGAWNYYLFTGDRTFLEMAFEVTENTLSFYEKTEFNPSYNLFRGLAWSDGVSAFEGKYANTGGSSAAIDWVKYNPKKKSTPGYGIPMMATYTNCLYYHAYVVAAKMEQELAGNQNSYFAYKATMLKEAINKYLWNPATGLYKFYIDEDEESNLQTAYGNALAIIFGIADKEQAESIFKNQYVSPAGVPCGWPPLKRYHTNKNTFARHNAVVWPQIQGFWVQAAGQFCQSGLLWHEMINLAKHAVRDMQFAEIYHPLTGEIYGGMQESKGKVTLWEATNRQTWSATAYIRMVVYGLLGVKIDEQGICFSPCVPVGLHQLTLSNLKYRDAVLQIKVNGNGSTIKNIMIDGKPSKLASFNKDIEGIHTIEINVANN